MGRVVSLIARKGGVGKTTIAANLAREAGVLAGETRLLDADPQRSLLVWASMGQGYLSGRVSAGAVEDEDSFRKLVAALKDSSSVVVIDSPPGFANASLWAIRASDLAVLPCGPSPLDLAATRETVALCRHLRPDLKVALAPSRFSNTSSLGRDLASSLGQLGVPVLPGIAQRVALAEAAMDGLTVGEYAPNSTAHREFQELAKAVWKCLHEDDEAQKAQTVGRN
jgi:chromosome partitioning protein